MVIILGVPIFRILRYIVPFGSTEPLSRHFMDTEDQYIVAFGNTEPTCMPLSEHFINIEGRDLVHQTERYQLCLTQSLMATKGSS